MTKAGGKRPARKRRFWGRVLAAIVTLALVALVVGAVAATAAYLHFSAGLPDHRMLESYEPPVATRVYAGDGSLMAQFASENRVFVPLEAISREGEASLSLRRGPAFLLALRHRSIGHRPCDDRQCRGRRRGQAASGRIDDHAAGGQELPVVERAVLPPQDQGSHPGVPDRTDLEQGENSRTLSQRDLPGIRKLRRRGRSAQLLQQVAG